MCAEGVFPEGYTAASVWSQSNTCGVWHSHGEWANEGFVCFSLSFCVRMIGSELNPSRMRIWPIQVPTCKGNAFLDSGQAYQSRKYFSVSSILDWDKGFHANSYLLGPCPETPSQCFVSMAEAEMGGRHFGHKGVSAFSLEIVFLSLSVILLATSQSRQNRFQILSPRSVCSRWFGKAAHWK